MVARAASTKNPVATRQALVLDTLNSVRRSRSRPRLRSSSCCSESLGSSEDMLFLRLSSRGEGPHVSNGRERASRGERGQNGVLHRFSEEMGDLNQKRLANAQLKEKGTAIAVPSVSMSLCGSSPLEQGPARDRVNDPAACSASLPGSFSNFAGNHAHDANPNCSCCAGWTCPKKTTGKAT